MEGLTRRVRRPSGGWGEWRRALARSTVGRINSRIVSSANGDMVDERWLQAVCVGAFLCGLFLVGWAKRGPSVTPTHDVFSGIAITARE